MFRSITSLEHSIYMAQIGPCFFQRSQYEVQCAWTIVLCNETVVAKSNTRVSVVGLPSVTLPSGLNSGSSSAQGEKILFAKLAFFSMQGSNYMQWLQKEMHGNSRHEAYNALYQHT